jgi:hypothetical protein
MPRIGTRHRATRPPQPPTETVSVKTTPHHPACMHAHVHVLPHVASYGSHSAWCLGASTCTTACTCTIIAHPNAPGIYTAPAGAGVGGAHPRPANPVCTSLCILPCPCNPAGGVWARGHRVSQEPLAAAGPHGASNCIHIATMSHPCHTVHTSLPGRTGCMRLSQPLSCCAHGPHDGPATYNRFCT